MTEGLFTPITLRGTTFKNRIWIAPMCQYSAVDGVIGRWHTMHLGSLASGGTGLAADADRVVRQSFASYRFLLRDPRVLLGNIAAASSFSALMLYISNGSLVFRDTFGMEPSTFGFVFTANALCMLAGSQIAPAVVARFGSTRVYLAAGLAAAAGMALMLLAGLMGAAGWFFGGLALAILAFGVALILPTKELMEIHPDRAGAGSALLRSGNMVAAAAAGFTLAHFATDTVVPMALGMLTLEAVAMASWLRRMRLPR